MFSDILSIRARTVVYEVGQKIFCFGQYCKNGRNIPAELFRRFLQQNGFTGDFTGKGDQRYLSRIHKSGAFSGGAVNSELAELIKNDGIADSNTQYADSLGEFDYTYGSGWVYTVNGNMPAYGMGKVNFTDGDTVRLAFTVAYGRDITGSQDSYDKTW